MRDDNDVLLLLIKNGSTFRGHEGILYSPRPNPTTTTNKSRESGKIANRVTRKFAVVGMTILQTKRSGRVTCP